MKRSRTMEDFFAGKTKVGLSHRKFIFNEYTGKTITFTGGEDISILEPAMYQVEEAGRLHQAIPLTEALEADGTE